MMQYKKVTISHAIYIKVFYDVTMSYLTISTNDVINTTNNTKEFPELRNFWRNILRLKSKMDLSLSTWIFGFVSILLV